MNPVQHMFHSFIMDIVTSVRVRKTRTLIVLTIALVIVIAMALHILTY